MQILVEAVRQRIPRPIKSKRQVASTAGHFFRSRGFAQHEQHEMKRFAQALVQHGSELAGQKGGARKKGEGEGSTMARKKFTIKGGGMEG